MATETTTSGRSAGCLTEDALAQIVWGRASQKDGDDAWKHLDACDACRELAAELARQSASDAPSSKRGEPPAPVPQVVPGATVGRYVVLERVGAGGMGIVYAAYDPELDRKVALKLLRPRRKAAELAREAQALARVSHPNVVAAYDVGTHGDLVTLVMELVDGVTLRTWLSVRERAPREILELFVGMGKGLAAAHGARVVHRDFKPENVIVGKDGRPRVTDFGLALVTDEPGEGPAALVGTLPYMAPEQLRGERAGERADQFAFAVSLYEALYGVRPFVGTNREELLRAIERGLPARSDGVARGVSARVRHVLARALAVDPARRFPSVDAMLQELAPRTRRTGVIALAVAAPVLLAVAAYGIVHERRVAREAVCHGAAQRLSGVWDGAQKGELERAFRATKGAPFAETTMHSVEGTLDAYSDAWVRTHTDVCEATRVRGEQSEALLDERMACLEDRRRELSSLVRELVKPTPHTVEVGVQAVNALSPVETCAGRRPVVGQARDPAKAPELEAQRDMVARARAEIDVGNFGAAEASLADALPKVKTLGDGRIVAEAELLLGLAQSYGSDLPKAEGSLLESVWSSESIGDDETAARALLRLSFVAGNLMANQVSGERYERHAEATLARLGSPPDLETELLISKARRLGRLTDYQGARTLAKSALALLESRGKKDTREAATAWNVVSIASKHQGDRAGAREAITRALEIRVRLLGPAHPEVLQALINLGTVELEEARYEDALRTFDEVLAALEATTGPKTRETAMAHNDRGLSLVKLGDLPGARAEFERAASIDFELIGDHPSTALYVMNVGDLNRADRKPKEALADYARASEILGRAKSPDPHTRARILAGRGQAQLDLGDATEAKGTLEAALAAYDGTSFDPADRADAAFALSRTLRALHDDEDRARSLALTARDGYATNLAVYGAEHDAVERFLTRSPSP